MLSPKEVIGNHIKRFRLKKGLSGAELAERLLCSQQHISRIERGVVRLNMMQIQYLADSLDITIDRLLEGIGFQNSPLERFYHQECYFQAEGVFLDSHS